MSYLTDLMTSARARLDEARAALTEDALEQRIASVDAPRGFGRALQGDDVAVIAEIKRRSPAAGDLSDGAAASGVAADYAAGGASAISVLTDPDHFKGSLDDLAAARGAGLPVLRKDFLLDRLQILEARAAGADGVLLIVKALGDELGGLVDAAHSLGMDALVEVHDESELERALATDARLIGVNHRDLETFEVDPDRTAKLAPAIPAERLVVALSGVSARADVERLASAGAGAVLVGESLMVAADRRQMVQSLTGVPRQR